jgi:hypothetical protein
MIASSHAIDDEADLEYCRQSAHGKHVELVVEQHRSKHSNAANVVYQVEMWGQRRIPKEQYRCIGAIDRACQIPNSWLQV